MTESTGAAGRPVAGTVRRQALALVRRTRKFLRRGNGWIKHHAARRPGAAPLYTDPANDGLVHWYEYRTIAGRRRTAVEVPMTDALAAACSFCLAGAFEAAQARLAAGRNDRGRKTLARAAKAVHVRFMELAAARTGQRSVGYVAWNDRPETQWQDVDAFLAEAEAAFMPPEESPSRRTCPMKDKQSEAVDHPQPTTPESDAACAHSSGPQSTACLDPDKPLPDLKVGSLVTAKKATGVCDRGEPGVVYERYELDGRPGWSVIFKTGRHDGFSPCEVDFFLDITGEVCEELSDYVFTNVLRLSSDYTSGHFAPAFKIAQWQPRLPNDFHAADSSYGRHFNEG